MTRRAIKDRSGEATTLHNIGFTYSTLAQSRQAMKFYKQAMTIYQQLGDSLGEISTLLNMGSLYATTKRKKLARSCYQTAQELAEQIEHQPLLEKIQQFIDSL